jgi:hypothetical protein
MAKTNRSAKNREVCSGGVCEKASIDDRPRRTISIYEENQTLTVKRPWER